MSYRRAYLIFDIETVPDTDALEKVGTDRDRQKYAEGEFLSLGFHRIIALSYLAYLEGDKGEKVKYEALASHDTSKLLDNFLTIICRFIDKAGIYPVIVSFNGNRFDLPVLRINILRHYPQLSDEARRGARYFMDTEDRWEREKANYQNKYSSYHIDLFEVFPARLELLCHLCGIEAKSNMRGNEVEGYYREGKLEEIAAYCAEDVMAQAKLLNKLLEIRGEPILGIEDHVGNYCTRVL